MKCMLIICILWLNLSEIMKICQGLFCVILFIDIESFVIKVKSRSIKWSNVSKYSTIITH